MVDVNNHELHSPFVFLIKLYGPPSLALRIEAAFPVHDDVSWLARGSTGVHVIAGDERTVLAVAG